MKKNKSTSRAGASRNRSTVRATAPRKQVVSEGRSLFAYACNFKRVGGGAWERGIMVQPSHDSDAGVIIDADGKLVAPPIYDWHDAYYNGTIRIDV